MFSDLAFNKNVAYKKTLNLSHKKISNTDYKQLINTIKRNLFFEKIILPKLEASQEEEFFSMLDEATLSNSTLTCIEIKDFTLFGKSPKLNYHYHRIASRLKRNQNKIFGIHGGGSIGIGLMADIVSRSSVNFKIIATSSDLFRNYFINYQNQVWLQHTNCQQENISCITDINMLDAKQPENIVHLYLHANLLALCLPEAGLINNLDSIARGLTARYFLDGAGLKILILMNKPNCDIFVRKLVQHKLLVHLNDPQLVESILMNIQFIPTVVDRIASKINTEHVITKIKKQLSQRNHSPQQPKDTLNVPLFAVEDDYNLFVPASFKEARFLPGIKTVKSIEVFMDIKNKLINGPHAMLAWLGALMDFSKVTDAMRHPVLYQFINHVIENEIQPILMHAYPELNRKQLASLKKTFIQRCLQNKSDVVKRVARDPLRKLNKDACIRGILQLKKACQLHIPTPLLEIGISAGLLYALHNHDPNNMDCNTIRNLYGEEGLIDKVLFYRGACSGGEFFGFDVNQEPALINRVKQDIVELQKISVFQQWKRLEIFNLYLNKRKNKVSTININKGSRQQNGIYPIAMS